MRFDVATLEDRRRRHPAWRLLRYQQSPLAMAFLHRAFVGPNTRALPEAEAIDLLDDLLYASRLEHPDDTNDTNDTNDNNDNNDNNEIAETNTGYEGEPTGKPARSYLLDWASERYGFVRRFYVANDDEAQIAITPGAERAIAWLSSLDDSGFVGTESRLLLAIELLRQLDVQTDANPERRLDDLLRRRAEIDSEIARAQRGDIEVLDDRSVIERFVQFTALARDLLADFRQVEENFRTLDRRVRERVAQFEGPKAALLQEIFGERDVITASDQGASFRAFWDLLSPIDRQDELTERLARVLAHNAVTATNPDRRLRHVHHDWFDAGDHTQRTVASLSAQLRRFIDETAWLENRRIIEIVRSIEHHAIEVRENPPKGNIASVETPRADIALPMERRLAAPPSDNTLTIEDLLPDTETDLARLFADTSVDLGALADHIDDLLIDHSQVTLANVCESRPIEHGLGELVAYLDLADARFDRAIDDAHRDRISWELDNPPMVRTVDMPRVIFVRSEPELI